MQARSEPGIQVPDSLLQVIESFPLEREVMHCGSAFTVSPFDIYAACPRCGQRIKVRSFSGAAELEDVFDAVLTWMNRPGASELVSKRRKEIAADSCED